MSGSPTSARSKRQHGSSHPPTRHSGCQQHEPGRDLQSRRDGALLVEVENARGPAPRARSMRLS